MNINVEDYLSQDEIKEIVKEEVKNSVKRDLCNEKETTRIITNISYYELWKEIEKEVPNCKDLIKEKVKEKLNEISSYDVLRRKGEFENNNSLAVNLIDQFVEENKNIIEDKIKTIFNGLRETDLKYDIQGILEEYIEMLFSKKEVE